MPVAERMQMFPGTSSPNRPQVRSPSICLQLCCASLHAKHIDMLAKHNYALCTSRPLRVPCKTFSARKVV